MKIHSLLSILLLSFNISLVPSQPFTRSQSAPHRSLSPALPRTGIRRCLETGDIVPSTEKIRRRSQSSADMNHGTVLKASPKLQSTFLKQAIPEEATRAMEAIAQISSPIISAYSDPLQLTDILAQFNEMLVNINGETLDELAPKMEFNVHALNEQFSQEQVNELFRDLPELRDPKTKKISWRAVLQRLCAHALDNSDDAQLKPLINSYCFYDPILGPKRIMRQKATLEILLKTPDRQTAACRQQMSGSCGPEIEATLVEAIE